MNKKLYIFITTLIRGVGGGHIYTLSKMAYLERIGYDTLFLHANDTSDKIRIEQLRKYEKCYDNHFFFPAFYFNDSIRNKVVDGIISKYCSDYTKYSEIFIESQTTTTSSWGEVFAERLGAKHLVYLLDEHPRISNKLLYDFYEFKLLRKELVGIGENSLKEMFEGWRELNSYECNFLVAHTPSPLADVDYDTSSFPTSDYVIGSITRLEKKFLVPALQVVNKFAKEHHNKRFLLLIIGGEIGGSKNESIIRKLFKDTINVDVIITGILYPLPIKLIRMPQIFLSTSGACLSSIRMGKITVPFDIVDGLPIGVAKYTTEDLIFRKDGVIPDLYNLLNEILIEKKYHETEVLYSGPDLVDYQDHLDYLYNPGVEAEYYGFEKCELDKSQRRKALLVSLLGPFFSKFLFKYVFLAIYKNK